MELSENELKDIENLLKKKSYNSLEKYNTNNSQLNKLKKNQKKKLILNYSKLKKTKQQVDDKFKFPKILLNIISKTASSKNENDYNKKIVNNNNKPNKQSKDSFKKNRSLIVKNILEQIRRKSKSIKPKSPNTNLKYYGELFPGPGYYNLNKNDIGNIHNLRYKNLFTNNNKKYKNLENNLERNVGPGTYNPTDNFNYISYSQNPKVYISSLERPSFINENDINKKVGPGSYEVSSSFDINNNKRMINSSNSIKNKNEKIRKLIQSELDLINNTHFFIKFDNNQKEQTINNISNFDNVYNNKINEKNIIFDDINFKNINQISRPNLHKNYNININKLKKKYPTHENINNNKISFPIIKNSN